MKALFRFTAIAALILIVAIFQPAHAQFLSYGVKGGLNLANIGGADAPESEARTGFHVGGFLGLSVLGIVAVEGGVYYSQKGYTNLAGDTPRDFVFNYIDVPLVAKFSPLPLIHLFAGPQLSYFLDGNIKDTDNDFNKENYTRPDMAVVVGAGMNIPGGLRISVGYDYGLTPINVDEKEIHNRVIKLSIGFKM
ncbi:MAG: porin family protein [Bacteroidota bacterium]